MSNYRYIEENRKEWIEGDNGYISEKENALTFFLDFFDLNRKKDTYSALKAVRDGRMDIQQIMENKPYLRLINEDSYSLNPELYIEMLMDFQEVGRKIFSDIFIKQRAYNSGSIYKTLLLNLCDAEENYIDYVQFFKLLPVEEKEEDTDTLEKFIAYCIDYVELQTAGIGKCEECGSYYPMYRGYRVQRGKKMDNRKTLETNTWCPDCRITMRMKRDKKNEHPIKKAYQNIYNRYFQQARRYKKITEEQFGQYTKIAAEIRDTYLKEYGQDNIDNIDEIILEYRQEVEKKVELFKEKGTM